MVPLGCSKRPAEGVLWRSQQMGGLECKASELTSKLSWVGPAGDPAAAPTRGRSRAGLSSACGRVSRLRLQLALRPRQLGTRVRHAPRHGKPTAPAQGRPWRVERRRQQWQRRLPAAFSQQWHHLQHAVLGPSACWSARGRAGSAAPCRPACPARARKPGRHRARAGAGRA